MKRNILCILLFAALVIGLLPQGILSVSAYDGCIYPVEGGNLYFDKETGTITGCDESVTKADIPAKIDGVAVTSIGGCAFSMCDKLKSVTIPSGVTNIDYDAFSYCVSLTSLTIPDSVTSIGDSAFDTCSSLTSVTLPDSVTRIGRSAFWGCSSLTSINIPDSVTSIGSWAFGSSAIYDAEERWTDGVLYLDNWLIEADNTVSGDYVVASGTTGIADYAFAYRKSLTSVTIPNSVTSIGEGTFFGCNSLTSVTIPDSVISIGSYAFEECGLTSITIPDSVTSIGEGAFSSCSSLTEINAAEDNTAYTSENGILFDKTKTALLAYPAGKPEAEYVISESVTNIGNSAFSGCNNLTSVMIPNSVTSIGRYAFCSCRSLMTITIPDSVTSIDDGVFSGCSSLTNVTIPDSVTSIGEDAFCDCSSLTSIHIPDSVTRIGIWAFADTAIYNAEERWIDGVLYFDNWLLEAEETVSGNYDVALGTTGIADGAFTNCSDLTSVTIPDSVTSIGEDAFGWSGLMSVTIGDSVTHIGEGAFFDCANLTVVAIGDGLTSIGDSAFYMCNNLRAVYFMGNAPALGDAAFKMWDEEANTEINLPGLTLYYIEGKEGWSSPTWNGYPTATWAPASENSYTDVSEKEWYFDAVQYATQNGLMNGVGNGKFDPEGSMTRAMLVTVLWRYEGEPAGGENIFTDVPNGTWYTDAVAWAAEKGIVGGIGNGKFDPEGNITREQMATILFRYAQKKCINTSKRGDLSGFADSGNVSSWAKDAVQWTVAEGIINGSDGKLLPQGNATRAQVSAILMRFIKNIAEDKFDTSGHTEVIDPAVPATCTESGLTEGKHCSVCGTVLVAQETVDALGHDYGAWTQMKAPTCTEKGEEKRVCSRCDAFEVREIAAHGHTEIVDAAVPATCTEAGKTEGKHCSVCGTVLIAQETVDALGHDYDAWTQTKAPSCTEKGEEKCTCSRCDAVETRKIAALGHDYGAWTQTKEPTCTEKGEEKRNCSRCGAFEVREIAAHGHTEIVDAAIPATCTEKGKTEGKHCSVCGTVLVAQETVDALGHDYGAWTQTKEPTCTEKGEEKRVCSRCDAFQVREIAAHGHTEIVDAAVPATCTEAGKTEGKHCSVCGTVLVAQETVDALGHDYGAWTQTKEPTCTEKGEEKRVCSRCDAFETRELDVTDHTEVIDPAVAATCAEVGKTEGKHCAVCSTVLVAQETVDALGHDYGAWTQVKAPTCTEKGEEKRVCSRCGFFETRELDITAHTEIIDPAVAATCTEAGKTEGKHCSVCGTVLVAQETVDALGHDYGAWTQTKAPTCTEKGEEKRTCSRCDAFEVREIAAHGHTEIVDAAIPATCTEKGKTEGKHCSVCGTVLVAQETVNALGHDYGAWTQTKEPTCTEKGEERRVCSRCDAFETRELDIVDPKHVVTAGTRKMYIGMSFELLLEYAGEPEEILSTTSGYTWYVYGTETYTDFVMAGVYEKKVVAICASGADFSYRGCTAYGSVAEAEEGDTYHITILKDKNDNSAVYGILLTDNQFRVQYATTEAALTGESRVAFHMANAFRVLHDASILEWCDNAATAARLHSEDMATNDYVSHTSQDGRLFYMRLKENGVLYRYCSENLCAGYYSGIGAHNAWVNSSGHRANLLSSDINRCGIGFAYGADSYYRYYAVTDYYHSK